MSNPSSCYGISEIEYKIILDQIERRARYRKEFLKKRSDPCKHSKESGYVFDEALQRFLSMKVSQLEYFRANPRTIKSGILMIILPMVAYGSAVWTARQKTERQIRCGQLKYKDRIFKFK